MTDLSLFASLLGKAGLYTGLLPGIFLAALIEGKYHRLQKFWERVRGEQLALRNLIPADLSSRATSSPRKHWRVA